MFKIGEKVTFLKESGFGYVRQIFSNSLFLIEDENGFLTNYHLSSLVKIYGEIDNEIGDFTKEDFVPKKKNHFSIIKDSKLKDQDSYWELDLHIESLLENHRGMSNFEILKHQMSEFKRFFLKAKTNRINKIVIIHGVGEGVLKNEIRMYLSQQEHIEFFDGSYIEYGKGATEVRLSFHQ